MNTLYSNQKEVTLQKGNTTNINCAVPFALHSDTRNQQLQIDPNELYYNPLTKTLHADNFSGGLPAVLQGEAIKLTTNDVSNRTTIYVDFGQNTEVITTLTDTDTFLVSNTQNESKTITALKLKEANRLTPGTALSFGTNAASNTLSLDSSITSTTLSTGYTWNGNSISSNRLSDGSISDTSFQRLSTLTSAILQTTDTGSASEVCPLDSNSIIQTQYLPGSVSDIIEVSTYTALPATGDSLTIYVTIDSHKAYRWGGSIYVEISASLVLGTYAGTAYEGSAGQANADAIATKQAQFGTTSTGGLAFVQVNSAGTLQIDMQKQPLKLHLMIMKLC